MIKTEKINQITKEPIMKMEESDIKFWHKKWDDLTIDEKADFLSVIGEGYLNESNQIKVSLLYMSYRERNL